MGRFAHQAFKKAQEEAFTWCAMEAAVWYIDKDSFQEVKFDQYTFSNNERMIYLTECHVCFRNMGPEGWKVRKQHFETVTSLVCASRNFFPEGVAAEIWSEFRFGNFYDKFSTNLYFIPAQSYFKTALLVLLF